VSYPIAVKPTRIHPCGLAVTLDGTIIVNVSHIASEQDPGTLLHRALEAGGDLFIGVVLTRSETREALRWIDDRAAEAAGHIIGQRQRRRRARERKNERRDS
jgi:hypothetical protein